MMYIFSFSFIIVIFYLYFYFIYLYIFLFIYLYHIDFFPIPFFSTYIKVTFFHFLFLEKRLVGRQDRFFSLIITHTPARTTEVYILLQQAYLAYH